MADHSVSDGGNPGWNDDPTPSEAVIEAIAEKTDSDPLELPALYNAIDPDALDSLFADRDGGTVTFCCCQHEITVKQDGSVVIREK